MKFVALLSGGKDSCYNVMKCQSYGHELICLANLFPPTSSSGSTIEEMNSFMYQSAAHNAIPQQGLCFGVPLIRREIHGVAHCQTLNYDTSLLDEVEDMYALLYDVKRQFPDIQGVSCGAILSTYQRFRVEDVCHRLGLTLLSYLWQRDPDQLLDEMLESGMEAVLVKVAGAGLVPGKHLGQTLSALRPSLQALHSQYGLDLCGEGGEYETLVLDCPAFTRRLVLDATEIMLDDEDCSVGNLCIKSCHTEPKSERFQCVSVKTSAVSRATVRGQAVAAELRKRNQQVEIQQAASLAAGLCLNLGMDGLGQSGTSFPSDIYEGCPADVGDADLAELDRMSAAARQQMNQVMHRLQQCVTQSMAAKTFGDVVFVHLYLSDIRLFAAANEAYCQFFQRDPPSRSCVQVPLPAGVLVCADCTVLLDSHSGATIQPLVEGEMNTEPPPVISDHLVMGRRTTLHVRAISEWAPMCIGPYAQANILCGHLVLVAGQIPLDPTSMTVSKPLGSERVTAVVEQLSLALQHAANVLGVTNSAITKAICFTVYVNLGRNGVSLTELEMRRVGHGCCLLLDAMVAEDRNTVSSHSVSRGLSDDDSDCDRDSDDGEPPAVISRSWPVLVIGVSGIPRDCLVEVEVTAVTHRTRSASLECSDHCILNASCVSLALGSAGSDVTSWPLWSARGIADRPSATPVDIPPCRHTIAYMIAARCLCSGVIHVWNHPSLAGLASHLIGAVRDAILLSQMDLGSLRVLRVYYPQCYVREEVVAATSASLGKFSLHFPVCYVPVLACHVTPGAAENGKESPDMSGIGGVGLSAQFLCVNLIQMRTEHWISNS